MDGASKIIYDRELKILKTIIPGTDFFLYHKVKKEGFDKRKIRYYQRRLEGSLGFIDTTNKRDHKEVYIMSKLRYETKDGFTRYTFPRLNSNRQDYNEIQYFPYNWYTETGLLIFVDNLI